MPAVLPIQALFKPGQLKPEASSFRYALFSISVPSIALLIPIDVTVPRSTAPYKIKTMILKTLAKIISSPQLYCYVPSPVNLVFAELEKALANGILKIDQPFRALYEHVHCTITII